MNYDYCRSVYNPFNFRMKKALDKYIGKKLDFVIIKLEKKENKVILSHRLIIEKERKVMHKKTLADLTIGQEKEGIVTNITKFGAFVEIAPGKDALLHISKISYEHIKTVEDVIKVDDEILVKVIEVDQQGKIKVSRKDVLPKPKPESNE